MMMRSRLVSSCFEFEVEPLLGGTSTGSTVIIPINTVAFIKFLVI